MLDERLVLATVRGAISTLEQGGPTPAVIASMRVERLVGGFLADERAAQPVRTCSGRCTRPVGFDEPWEEERQHVPWHLH